MAEEAAFDTGDSGLTVEKVRRAREILSQWETLPRPSEMHVWCMWCGRVFREATETEVDTRVCAAAGAACVISEIEG